MISLIKGSQSWSIDGMCIEDLVTKWAFNHIFPCEFLLSEAILKEKKEKKKRQATFLLNFRWVSFLYFFMLMKNEPLISLARAPH